MAGPLDLIALNAAMARLSWLPNPHGLFTAQGYRIVTTGDNPSYHTAYRPGGLDPTHELAAGAGDLGLAKCKRYCERHLERSSSGDEQPAPALVIPPAADPVPTTPTTNEPARNSNVPTSGQAALF